MRQVFTVAETPPFEPLLWTDTEVAGMLRVPRAVVARLTQNGALRAVRIDGRPATYRPDDVRHFVQRLAATPRQVAR